VLRDGAQRRIAGREVVPGDLMILQEGDRVPAVGALLECGGLSADESLLTGESLPVTKKAGTDEVREMARAGGDGLPFVYSGTLVVVGHGAARILATGAHTQIGRIGKALERLEVEKTQLQVQTARAVRVFAAIGLAACLAVVVLYGVLRDSWLDGLLAGITLAMAALPEEFPVVLTVFLALGAWRISQQKVLTRRMPAIETLGSATVLCVDKTGTLTENRMAVAELAVDGAHHEVAHGALPPSFEPAVLFAALACELEPFDPMERAIVTAVRARCGSGPHPHGDWSLVREYALTRDLLAVTHCWQSGAGGAVIVAAKGAPEAIARLCNTDAAQRARILEHTATIAARGRRVLGVAQAEFHGGDFPDHPDGFAFSFIGLIALADPVRQTVPRALQEVLRGGHPGRDDHRRLPGNGAGDRRRDRTAFAGRRFDRRRVAAPGRRAAAGAGRHGERLRPHASRAEAGAGRGAEGQRRDRRDDRRRRERRAGAEGAHIGVAMAAAAPTWRARPPRRCCWKTTSSP
jgi:Ca2+-transporting ATPase